MYLKKLTLDNYANFEHLELDFSTQEGSVRPTILLGENGAGKTNVLVAIASLLSWFVGRLRYVQGAGNPLHEKRIRLGSSAAVAQGTFVSGGEDWTWSLAKNSKGKRRSKSSTLLKSSPKAAYLLADSFAEQYTENPRETALPLVAYYPATRHVLNIPQRIRTRHSFEQIDGYQRWALKNGEWDSLPLEFSKFFEWFKEGDDLGNELFVHQETWRSYLTSQDLRVPLEPRDKELWYASLDRQRLQKDDPELARRLKLAYGPHFFSVSKAILKFLPECTELKINRSPLRMSVVKNGQTLDVRQLSQGERSLMGLIADIAYRLSIMNPAAEDPLQGQGIVLIDEVDLHLHPRWQRTIVDNLRQTFPNCQFILTTNSALVVSHCQHALVYRLQDGTAEDMGNLFGKDIDGVLRDDMDTPLRDEALQERINDLLDAIELDDFDKAKAIRQELLAVLPSDHTEIVRADIFLHLKQCTAASRTQDEA